MDFLDLLLRTSFRETGLVYNLYKLENGLQLDLALPGYNKEDISVTFSNKILSLNLKGNTQNKEAILVEKGFKVQDLKREILFTNEYEEISATYKNGILSIILQDQINKKEFQIKVV